LALLYNWEGTPRSEVKSSNASKVLLNFSQKLVYPLGRKKKEVPLAEGENFKVRVSPGTSGQPKVYLNEKPQAH